MNYIFISLITPYLSEKGDLIDILETNLQISDLIFEVNHYELKFHHVQTNTLLLVIF